MCLSAIMGGFIHHLGSWRSFTTQAARDCDVLTVVWIAPKKQKGEKMDLGTFLQDPSMRPILVGFRRCRARANSRNRTGFLGR